MALSFELSSHKAVLAAGYQPAAILSPCIISREVEVLSQTYSRFSGKFQRTSDYWLTQVTHLFVCVGNVLWVWPVLEFIYGVEASGRVEGDPVITSVVSPTVRAWL